MRFVIAIVAAMTAGHVQAAKPDSCSSVLTIADAEAKLLDDPDLRLAHHDVDGAIADLRTAGERPNPNLNFSSSAFDPRNGLGSGDALHKQFDTVLQFEQPFERGGKRRLRRAGAQAGIDAAQATFADLRRQATLALRQAFYDLQLAEQKLAINHDIAEAQASTERAAQQRLHDGDIAAADVARLRVETSKAQNDVRQAETDLATARINLGYLMGCGADASYEVSGDWPSMAELPPLQDSDVDQRADVVAARAKAAQASSGYSLAKAQAVRDVTVGFEVEHYPGGPPAPSDGQLLLGFDISVPLHLYHANEGEISRALSDASAGEDGLAQARAQAAADLAKAHGDLLASAARARNYHDSILPQAQSAADSIEYAYKRGALPLLDLLDARRTLHATRIEAATAQSDYAKSLAAWRAANERYGA